MYFNTIRITFIVRFVLNMKKEEIIKPTLVDYAILGLIQNQSLSGYAIRKIFEETALGKYSSSPGTIYPALKRLQGYDLVEKQEQENSKKTGFHITEKGIAILKNWFLKPIEKIDIAKSTDELFLRFGFMESLLEKKDKIIFLTSFRDLLHIYIEELQDFYNKESKSMPLHGQLAFQYGIDSNRCTLEWCKKAISKVM